MNEDQLKLSAETLRLNADRVVRLTAAKLELLDAEFAAIGNISVIAHATALSTFMTERMGREHASAALRAMANNVLLTDDEAKEHFDAVMRAAGGDDGPRQ